MCKLTDLALTHLHLNNNIALASKNGSDNKIRKFKRVNFTPYHRPYLLLSKKLRVFQNSSEDYNFRTKNQKESCPLHPVIQLKAIFRKLFKVGKESLL